MAATITFSHTDYPSWTGNIVNTGTVKFAGTSKNAAHVGGFIGYMPGNMPALAEGNFFINLGDIVCSGTYDKSRATNGVGGIVGRSLGTISNAKVHCLVEAVGAPNVGMITGSERTEATLVSNCEIGGTICTTSEEKETTDGSVSKVPVAVEITADNFYEYIYGGTTAWEGTNYDGCSFLPVKPTI